LNDSTQLLIGTFHPALKATMKNIFLLTIAFCLLGCTKDEPDQQDTNHEMWYPYPRAIIDNSKVELSWYYPYYYYKSASEKSLIYIPDYVEPDFFEIYSSEGDMNHFDRVKIIRNDKTYTYSFNNLSNGKSYYFYVKATKLGYQDKISDTIVAVPNPPFSTDSLILFDYTHTALSCSYATALNKIAYVDLYHTREGGENCCSDIAIIISDLDGSNPELLDIQTSEPDWSPDNSKIAFRCETGEVSHTYGRPSQIAIFDYNTKEITHLTNDTLNNYCPVFSSNGQLILYQSNRNCANFYATNIWLFNMNTQLNEQIIDIARLNLQDALRPNWIDNNYFLFQGKGFDYRNKIYKSSIIEKQTSLLFPSWWNDYCPSISPDHKKLAFVSDRSGTNQVWIYDLISEKYTQVSGFDLNDYIDPTWCKISWKSSSEIIFPLTSNKLIKRKII
jgi:hypothetical protein